MRDDIIHGQNFFRNNVRNNAIELVFKIHDQLDRTEAVSAEIVNKTRTASHLLFFHAGLFYLLCLDVDMATAAESRLD